MSRLMPACAQTCSSSTLTTAQLQTLSNNCRIFKKQSGERPRSETELQRMETRCGQTRTISKHFFLSPPLSSATTDHRVIEFLTKHWLFQTSPQNGWSRRPVYAQWVICANSKVRLKNLRPHYPQPARNHGMTLPRSTPCLQTNESLKDLRTCLDLSAKRLQRDPKARDLLAEVRKDQRFTSLHNLPEFQKLVPPN